MKTQSCPCGSGTQYPACCGPYHQSIGNAPTPEALMRSRYSAYALGLIDYIAATQRGEAAISFDKDRSESRAKKIKWLTLEIIAAPTVILGSTQGFVEFKATYQEKSKPHELHELSEFKFEDGQWFYIKGHYQ